MSEIETKAPDAAAAKDASVIAGVGPKDAETKAQDQAASPKPRAPRGTSHASRAAAKNTPAAEPEAKPATTRCGRPPKTTPEPKAPEPKAEANGHESQRTFGGRLIETIGREFRAGKFKDATPEQRAWAAEWLGRVPTTIKDNVWAWPEDVLPRPKAKESRPKA
jgi:hypothetical protein